MLAKPDNLFSEEHYQSSLLYWLYGNTNLFYNILTFKNFCQVTNTLHTNEYGTDKLNKCIALKKNKVYKGFLSSCEFCYDGKIMNAVQRGLI